MTSSSYLALAIFPASFRASGASNAPGHTYRVAEPRARAGAPTFPPAFLAFLGTIFLLAGGDPAGSPDRVSVSLGLILAALVWIALLLVVDLHRTTTPRPEGR